MVYIYSARFREANEIVGRAEICLQIIYHGHLFKSLSKYIVKDPLIFRGTAVLYVFKQSPI